MKCDLCDKEIKGEVFKLYIYACCLNVCLNCFEEKNKEIKTNVLFMEKMPETARKIMESDGFNIKYGKFL